MKKLLCLLLTLSIALGGFVFNAAAEESNDAPDISTDVSSAPEDSSEPDISVDAPSTDSEVSADPGVSTDPGLSTDPEVSTEPSEECSVGVQYDASCGEITGWSDSETYYVGGTLTLKISPFHKKGIASITVNGEELEDVPVSGGTVDIPLTETEVEIIVLFGDTVKVLIDCGEGGSFTVEGRRDVQSDSNFDVIVGTDVVIRIRANANQALKSISDNGEKVERLSYTYTIKDISEQHHIVITFRETGNTDVEVFDVSVRVEGNGAVSPSGVVQVEKGDSLVLELTPDSGYAVKSVTDRGTTKTVLGNTYTVKDIYEDCTVTVSFGKVNEDEPDESKPEDSSSVQPPVPGNADYITREEVEASKVGNNVFISLSQKTKIGKSALAYINELAKDKNNSISIGVSGSYQWVLPKNASFDISVLADDGINFGINIDKGAVSVDIKKALAGKVDETAFDLQNNITVERLSAARLPEGTRLELSLGTFGQAYGWFKYELSGNVSPVYEQNGALAIVANDGCVTVDMPAPQLYGALVAYKGQYVSATVKWNSDMCDLSIPGAVTVGENGDCSAVIAWQKGVDFSLTVSLKDGYAIDAVTSAEYGDMTLFGYGMDVTASAAKGEKGSVEIKIPAISKGGVINIKAVENTDQSVAAPGGKTPWDVIILIAVIVIAMVAGGIVFVVKWRQSDDDDDDYEDDDEDYEDEDE